MRTVTPIALLVGLSGACSSKKQEPPPAPPPPRQGIEMVSQGAPPHRALRYQLAKGMKTTVELEAELDVMSPNLQHTSPTTVTVMEIGADDVLPDGNTKVRTRLLRMTGRDRPGAASLEALNAQGQLMTGVELTGMLTPRGRILDPQLAGSARLPAEVAQNLSMLVAQSEDVAMPLPEPGVGVGAVWRVRRDLSLIGIKLETITEIQVTALEDQRMTYTMRTEAKGENQIAQLGGMQFDVTKIHGAGTGKGVLDLSRMVNFGEQTLELGWDIAAADQSGSMKIRTVKRLKPASPDAAGQEPAKPEKPAGSAKPEKPAHDPGAH